MKRVTWCAVFIVASVVWGTGQTIKVPESWNKLAAKADEVVHVDLNRNMLGFASNSMDKNDTKGRQIVSKLNGIYVQSLRFKQAGAFTDADVEPIRAQLRGPEWVHIVDVVNKPDQEHVQILLKEVNNNFMGMVILAQEPKELTFVHLDGPIDPKDIGALGGNFGIPKDIHVAPGEAKTPTSEAATVGTSKPAAPAATKR